MNYTLLKMKIKSDQTDKVAEFLNNLFNNSREEMIENGKKSNLIVDSYFIDNEFLYVFKKQSEENAHLHLTAKELANNKLLKTILNFTDEFVESTESIKQIMTIDTESNG